MKINIHISKIFVTVLDLISEIDWMKPEKKFFRFVGIIKNNIFYTNQCEYNSILILICQIIK